MRYQYKIANNNIVFSKWTRKSYAVFASLHKVIIIAQLSVDICISLSGKNQSILRLFNQGTRIDISENDSGEQEAIFSECLIVLLIESGLISIDESSSLTKIYL